MTKPAAAWYSIRRHTAVAAAVLASAALAGTVLPKSSAEILIYGDIGESWWSESVSAAQFVREIGALDVDAITVRLNSIGGSVPDGIAIYNAIKRHPAHVTTIADGMALSIASLILCAGDTVQMAENAALMVHAPWTVAAGNSAELRDLADLLDTWAKAMSTSYAAKTGETAEAALVRLTDGKDHWFTAAEAKAAGFIDEVVTAAPVAAMAGFDLSKFRDVPSQLQALARPAVASSSTAPAPSAAAAAHSPEPSPMTTPNPQAAAQQTQAAAEAAAAIEAARAAGVAQEAQRRNDIEAAFKPFAAREGMAAIMAACLADPKVDAAAANGKILAAMAAGVTSAAGSYVATTADETDKRADAASQYLMARAGLRDKAGKPIAADRGNPFRGMTLLEMARASLARAGVKTEGMDKMSVVAAAFTQSTSDFPVLLENTMHKTLQASYAVAALTWSRFCKTGSVSDFRPHNRYRTSSLSNLDSVNELGEFINKTIPDGEKSAVQIGTKGNIINLSRQAIVNDDLDAFVGLAAKLGRASARTIESMVYALLAENGGLGPTMTDGLALFHATHGNLTAGAAISVEALDVDRVALASQLDVGGNDYLDLRPAVLLVPIGLGGTARVINQAQYDPDTSNKLQRPNKVLGLFSDIVDTPRLSGTRRYLFADKDEAPVIEVSFLDGAQEPVLESEDGFTVDGTRWKVRLDVGVDEIDYRGAITNAGA